MNAWHLTTMVHNLSYVEGYAMSPDVPVPLLHAWCADEAGRADDTLTCYLPARQTTVPALEVGDMLDHCGNTVCIGDTVVVVHADSSRGATGSMFLQRGEVVGIGRSRVVLRFASLLGEYRVGVEALRVVEAHDGRKLITPNEAWETDHGSSGQRS
jgi:hypothetical protein